jgi:hypothetical protein
LRQLFGTVRWTYNQCVAHIRTTGTYPSRKLLRSLFANDKAAIVQENPWVLKIGYDIRDDAIKRLHHRHESHEDPTQEPDDQEGRAQVPVQETRPIASVLSTQEMDQANQRNTIVLKLPNTKPLTFWTGKKRLPWPHLDGLQASTDLDW